MIAGLLKKDSGSIILDSEDVSDKDISERSNLGLSYLPQEASIFRKLTVKEQREHINCFRTEETLIMNQNFKN